ncbi:hypothetical protein Hanom_Chr08g00709651 [Helianthus anomalus]
MCLVCFNHDELEMKLKHTDASSATWRLPPLFAFNLPFYLHVFMARFIYMLLGFMGEIPSQPLERLKSLLNFLFYQLAVACTCFLKMCTPGQITFLYITSPFYNNIDNNIMNAIYLMFI